MDTNVLIVGAGPAGAWLGYRLAADDIPVMILEKEHLPRYKSCAGILSNKSAQFLREFDLLCHLQQVVEHQVRNVIFRHYDDPPIKTSSEHDFLLVMRSRFDAAMVQLAQSAGADVRTGQRVNSIAFDNGEIRCITQEDEYRGTIVVGADGANSVVRKTVHGSSPASGIALQAEIEGPCSIHSSESEIVLDLRPDLIPGGYGWLVPKRDFLSVGIGCVGRSPSGISTAFSRYLTTLQSENDTETLETAVLRAHPLCTFIPQDRPILAGEGWVCVGDAAALADPITGEGIYQALLSAEMAYRAICEVWPERNCLPAYRSLLQQHLLSQLHLAYRLAEVLYRWPSHCYRLVQARSALMQTFLAVTQGGETHKLLFKQLRQYLPSALKNSKIGRSLMIN